MDLAGELAEQLCEYSKYGCDFKGSVQEMGNHVSHSEAEHLALVEESHSQLKLKYSRLERRFEEAEIQAGIEEDKFRAQTKELAEVNQKVPQLMETLTKLENQIKESAKMQESVDALQSEDRVVRMEVELRQTAEESELEECQQIAMESQERCQRVEDKMTEMERDAANAVWTGTQQVSQAVMEEMRTQLCQIGSKLGMYDVRLAEQDLRFQDLEMACYNGELIWKIEDYTRRKHDAVVGKTLSLNSQPFYTSRYGYKMCARVYLNGDGIGEGTHMSLFIVLMRGDYDDFPGMTWPFNHQVTFTLLAQDAQRQFNISKTMRPDPTSTSLKKPTGAMNVAAGCPLFVSQTDVEIPTYIKDDTLFIKVSVAC